MAGRRDLLSASGGGAASAPAFAGFGLYEVLFSSELPRPVIYGLPVLRSPCQALEVVRRQACKAGMVANDDEVSSY